MPTHPDAIGYIRDLGQSEDISWLEMICDLASSGKTTISSTNLEILVQLFTKNANYLRQPASPVVRAVAGSTAPSVEHLKTIGPFNGFKRLSNTLVASFPKRATIIFGANGSGKSSICEALKILASHDAPRRPLHDVHAATNRTPSFSFRFTSDTNTQLWTSSAEYGTHSTVLKYFDTGIAIHNIQNSVQPGRIIELSPFKLDVFEIAKDHCVSLRNELQRKRIENETLLRNVLERILFKFKTFEGTLLAGLTSPTAAVLDVETKLGDSYSEKSGLDEKLKRKLELEKATSEEGLKLIKGEAAALKALHGEIEPILSSCEKLIEINPVAQERTLKSKENELEVLAKVLIPSGATLDKLMALIRPANEICSLHSPKSTDCPLCKQALHKSELELFKQYATLLTLELDTAITKIRKLLKTAEEKLKVITDLVLDNWAKDSVLAQETIDETKNAVRAIQTRFVVGSEIDQDCKDATSVIRDLSDDLLKFLKKKEQLIEEAGKNRAELFKQLAEISKECKSLLYVKEISENIELLKEAHDRTEIEDFWESSLPIFTSVLRKVTSRAKKAHKELVVEDFKTRLNSEYLTLAEKDMRAFGVALKDVGGDGTVTVDHHVAGEKIEAVLSEGELRIHALALFFAELETCMQQVIVFDDPISSFDYNYIGNYCYRLRDLIKAYPNRQIIVLTHNWEFFMQIQKTLKDARLEHHMSVNVLESCTALDVYSEKITDLKEGIDALLRGVGEPTKSEKEVLAGKMRRLLEAVVNTHVFNKQRHQYKQKSQAVSAFHDFTKIVPLLSSEAQTLKDLFSKLSITEHDDPRNAYVNTDKAMFQTRYNAIKAIETAIINRK